jgi:two-component system, chemotaxis family, sensor kinase Cph1
MTPKPNDKSAPTPSQTELRDQAEARLKGNPVEKRSAGDTGMLVEELIIHQEELSIQNEELKRIQLEVEATKAKYFELYDLAPVGYLTLNPELIIKEANLAASILLGCDRNRLIGKRLSSFLTPDSNEKLFLHYSRVTRGERERAQTFGALKDKESEVQIQFESNVIEGGSEKGFRSTLTDVTELKKAEEALIKARNELELEVQARTEELQKSNAELRQFAYVASHDLQEPLRMVISYLTLLEDHYQDKLDEDGSEFIHYAVDGGKRMKALIDDLLAYSRIENKGRNFAPVNMNEVMENVVDGLTISMQENGASIILDTMPTIWADESQMLQLMQNLVSNAIKFHGPDRPVVHVSATEQERGWTFSVRDNGIGLSMEYSERIFQMFQRLHSRDRFPGSGVGLAIVKKVVERQGGKIWVESEEGKGATFFFTVPKVPNRSK